MNEMVDTPHGTRLARPLKKFSFEGEFLIKRRTLIVVTIMVAKVVIWYCYQAADEEGIDLSYLQ